MKPKVKISWKPVNDNKTKRNKIQIKVDTCRALLPLFFQVARGEENSCLLYINRLLEILITKSN